MWFCPTCKVPVNKLGVCPQCDVQYTTQTALLVQNPPQSESIQNVKAVSQGQSQVIPQASVVPQVQYVQPQPPQVQYVQPQQPQNVVQAVAAHPPMYTDTPHHSLPDDGYAPRQRNKGYVESDLCIFAIMACIVSVVSVAVGVLVNIMLGLIGVGVGAILSYIAVRQLRHQNLSGGLFVTIGKIARVAGLILFVCIFLYGMIMQVQTFSDFTNKLSFLGALGSSFSDEKAVVREYTYDCEGDGNWDEFVAALTSESQIKGDTDLAERLSKLTGVHTSYHNDVSHNTILIVDGSGFMYVDGKQTGTFEGGLKLVYDEVSRITLYSDFGFAYGGVAVYVSKYALDEDLLVVMEAIRERLPSTEIEWEDDDGGWLDWFKW